jgi:iron complex outermembrane receptor protein
MTRPPRAHQGRRTLAAALLAAVLTAAPPAPAADTAAPPPELPAGGFEEPGGSDHFSLAPVVVTARKVEEPLEDTPVSVTPLSAATLEKAEVRRLDEIQDLVPNLTFVTNPNGVAFNALIRGVGQLEEAEPGVGVYLDGVYLPSTGNALLNVVDIERIEVLRGPQGTLFGKNTIGGAINITSVKPSEELEASGFVRGGNFGTFDSRATLDVPISRGPLANRLFTHFSFASANTDGYTENVDPRFDQNYNDRSALWGLGSLRFVPRDDLEIDVSGNWFQDDSHGAGGRCTFVEPPPDPTVAALLKATFPDFAAKCRASRNFEFRSDVDGVAQPTDYGTWGNATWSPGSVGFLDELRVKMIASWREQSLRFLEDPERTDDRLVVLSALGGADRLAGDPRTSRDVSVEGQLQGRALGGRIESLTGVFAQWEDSFQNTATRALEGTIGDFFGGTIIARVDQNNSDWAVFNQTTYNVLDWLAVTGGVRYTQESKNISRFTVNPFGTLAAPGVPQVVLNANGSKVFDAVTPMATVTLHATDALLHSLRLDHLMSYFTYSTGFKGGGFNQISFSTRQETPALQPFAPEYLDSYEIGVKAIAFDRRLFLSSSFFLARYKDIQVDQRLVIPGANPGDLPTVEIATLNAAKATTRGLELEAQAAPTNPLRLSGSVGLLHATFDQFVGPSELDNAVTIDRAGQTFNDVPEVTAHAAVEYTFPIDPGPDSLRGTLTPRLDWSYRSKVHSLAPEVKEAVQPGYNLLGARLAYQFAADHALVALFAQNLTDEEYFGKVESLVPFFGVLSRYYQPPRTFGVEVSYRY